MSATTTHLNNKRRLDDGDMLQVKVAAASEPLAADRAILAAFSSCVRGLPSEAVECDVSGLLVEGQPVQQEIVLAWLQVVYTVTLDEPFEQLEPASPVTSMAKLGQLLAFADAVGSSKGLLKACCAGVASLHAAVQLPERQQQLKLAAAGCAFEWAVNQNEPALLQRGGADARFTTLLEACLQPTGSR